MILNNSYPLKIVWICHFSNKFVQNLLGIKRNINEFAPWISFGIEEAKRRRDIELHIISPHKWVVHNQYFRDGNIHYHFFNSGMFLYGRHWPNFFKFDLYTKYYFNSKKIFRIVNAIKPDLVHLHGAENAYYSSSIFKIYNTYPTLITIQGFIARTSTPISSKIKKRIQVENSILKQCKNFGVRNNEMIDYIKGFNSSAKFYWHEYFLNNEYSDTDSNQPIKYDIIFFASLSKNKGIEDLIKITAILLQNFPNIKVAVVGSASRDYFKYLKQLCFDLALSGNIEFFGFLSSQSEVYKILKSAKVSVLPTYNDIIPGTIIESMLRKVPVITYKTGGIPEINKEDQNIIIIDQGNYSQMAIEIKTLLYNSEKRLKLADKAYNYALSRWSNARVINDLIRIYSEIINQ